MPIPLRVATLACIASVSALAVAGWELARPEALIERSYAEAFDRLDDGRAAAGAVARSVAGAAAFDPAHVHLSRMPAATPIGPVLAVGDRITLAQREGGVAAYEVIDVRPLSAKALGAEDAGLPRLLLVTAVTSGRAPAQTMRFIVDADAPASAAMPAFKPHAL